jgi:hypothetical protein
MGTSPLAALNFGGTVLLGGQPATVSPTTITFPANPVADGTIAGICNVTGSNFSTTPVAISANTNQTLNTTFSLTNLGTIVCVRYQFNRATTTWYRIQ